MEIGGETIIFLRLFGGIIRMYLLNQQQGGDMQTLSLFYIIYPRWQTGNFLVPCFLNKILAALAAEVIAEKS